MRSVLCTPRSAIAPKAARFLSKNQEFRDPVQPSGPGCPKVVWKASTRPIAPSEMSLRASTWARAKRWFCAIMRNLPLFSCAWIMASTSSGVTAMGFSHSTWMPRSSAAMAAEAWATLALQMLTASTPLESSASSES